MSKNPKTTLGILTMSSPLIVVGSCCSLATVWYQISGVPLIHHEGSVEYPVCTDSLYLQILNGMCSRGKVDGIDVAASCMQWTDASAWTQLDASNMASVASGLASSRTTDLATEVTQLWQILGKLCMVCIALSTINFVLCIAASDLDFNEWSIDTDKLTMLTSGVLSAIVLALMAYMIITIRDTQMLDANTWTTIECTYTSGPSFGYFLLILAALFAFVSVFASSYAYIFIYVFPTKEGQVTNLSSIAPNPEEVAVNPRGGGSRRARDADGEPGSVEMRAAALTGDDDDLESDSEGEDEDDDDDDI